MRHPDGRTTIIPIHPGEKIGNDLLMKNFKDVDLRKEAYLKL